MKSINRDILKLAIPSILANITVPIVGMVDIAVAGHINPFSGEGITAAAMIGGIAIGTMLFDLLHAGILYNKEGKLTESAKAKILSMMGFGNWDNAQDITQLHIDRAQNENVDMDNAQILPVDDHALHVEEHTRFVISNFGSVEKAIIDKVLAHIELHKNMQTATEQNI